MTEPKETSKLEVSTRAPKKKTQGIFDNLRKLPGPHPVEEILGLVDTHKEDELPTPSTPSIPSTPSSGSRGSTQSRASTPSIDTALLGRHQKRSSIAPERDFTRFANSITREAVPAGTFGEQGGKSKELYDCLYSLTRGAVVPRRKVRISKDRLMAKAGIGSEVTLRKNLLRLRATGLIEEKVFPGTHGGNEYEVFLPEEIGQEIQPTPSTPSTPSIGSNPRQDREGVEALDPRASTPRLSEDASGTSGQDKTLLKDLLRNDDDEAFASLRREIREATGKEVSAAALSEIDELLAIEFKIASSRTTVSSGPAFLAEHLRRRLFKKDKRQLEQEAARDTTTPLPTAVDIRTCPDCRGSNYYYPDGYESGVKRCVHVKLRSGGGSESPPMAPSGGDVVEP